MSVFHLHAYLLVLLRDMPVACLDQRCSKSNAWFKTFQQKCPGAVLFVSIYIVQHCCAPFKSNALLCPIPCPDQFKPCLFALRVDKPQVPFSSSLNKILITCCLQHHEVLGRALLQTLTFLRDLLLHHLC